MDFNTTIDIIIKDLREAREIIDDFKNYPGVPGLQVELAKSKCRSAEEIIALLKTLKGNQQEEEAEKVEGVEKVKEVEDVNALNSSEEAGQMDLFEISDEDEVEPVDDGGNLKEELEAKGPEKSESIFSESDFMPLAKQKDKTIESNIVADKFSGISSTVNEQLGTFKSDGDFSSVLKSRPVTNLNEAIGVNDKFLFIREVFSGNQVLYNEAISKLNKVDNLTDAKAVIMSYTGESEEDEAVKQLLDLVKRKLASDE